MRLATAFAQVEMAVARLVENFRALADRPAAARRVVERAEVVARPAAVAVPAWAAGGDRPLLAIDRLRLEDGQERPVPRTDGLRLDPGEQLLPLGQRHEHARARARRPVARGAAGRRV